MERKILSICIPIYNRADLFRYALKMACIACAGFEEHVEIVVSDNNSEEDIKKILDDTKREYNKVSTIYHRNQKNIGMARNFFKVVDLASGNFCWIIGSDDFVKKDSVSKLISVIKNYEDISFISLNYDLLDLRKIFTCDKRNNNNTDISLLLKQNTLLDHHIAPATDLKSKIDVLIDPVYNNVFLGAMMTGVFRKNIWDSVDISNIEFDGFDSLESMYPHCYIYAIAVIGKAAYYCGNPLVTVGEGAREWGTDTGNSYWESSLPLIHFRILTDMIELYKRKGLDKTQYFKCKRNVGFLSGKLFIPILLSFFVKNMKVQNKKIMHPFRILKKHIMNPGFYKGMYYYLINKTVR